MHGPAHLLSLALAFGGDRLTKAHGGRVRIARKR